jgi:hypothetical protein
MSPELASHVFLLMETNVSVQHGLFCNVPWLMLGNALKYVSVAYCRCTITRDINWQSLVTAGKCILSNLARNTNSRLIFHQRFPPSLKANAGRVVWNGTRSLSPKSFQIYRMQSFSHIIQRQITAAIEALFLCNLQSIQRLADRFISCLTKLF